MAGPEVLCGPGAGGKNRHVQRHECLYKAWQGVGLASTDDGPDEFGDGAGQRIVRFAGDGRPFRVAGASPPGHPHGLR